MQRFFTLFLTGQIRLVEGSNSLFTNQNYFSCYLLLHIPIGIYLYFKSPVSFSKNLIGIGWIIILIALGLSDSQAAQFIASIQIGLAILYFLAHKKTKQIKLLSLATLVAFLISFSLIKLIPTGNNYLLDNTYLPKPGIKTHKAEAVSISTPQTEIEESEKIIVTPKLVSDWLSLHVGLRLRYWLGALKIFHKHWLLGSGLWTYYELYPYTGLMGNSDQKRGTENHSYGDMNMLPPHSHSLYFQTAAETGLVGFVLLSSCLVFLFRSNIKLLIENRREPLDLNFFLLTSATGFLIHNISEYNWLNSLFTYYFALLLVSMGHLNRISSMQNHSSISLRKVFLLPSVLLLALTTGFTLVNFYKYYQTQFKPIGLEKSMIEYNTDLNLAKNLCDRCARPRYLLGLSKLKQYQTTKNNKFLNAAQKEFSESLARNSYNPKLNMLQGDIFILQGNKKEARNSYQMAMKHPWFTSPAMQKLNILEN